MAGTSGSWSRSWLRVAVASTFILGAVACAPQDSGPDEGRGDDGIGPWTEALTGQKVSRRTTLAVILVELDGAGFVDTPATTRAELFTNTTSVRNLLLESSYGQHDLSGDAFGPFPVPTPPGCDLDAIRARGEGAATAAGVNLAAFTNVAIYFPHHTPCKFYGSAQQGTPANPQRVIWLNGDLTSAAHELGHNFGLFDAGDWNCPGASIAAPSTCSDGRGDPFDPMGTSKTLKRHHNAYEKTAEGWFGRCNVVNVPVSRTIDIVPLETASNGVQAVRVPMSPSLCPIGITSCRYVIEYRQPLGFDANTPVPNGVYIHVGSNSSFVRSSYLLDMTPATPGMSDNALPVGSTFTDPNGVAIKVQSATADRATVRITVPRGFGSATCLDGSIF